jgi:threonine dehydrogenase-like Zn-dependent dehydrogenase
MRALYYDGSAKLADIAEPELRDGEISIRVDLAAVTGLDRDVAMGKVPFSGVLGSAFVGVVESARGESHQNLVGRRVVGRTAYGCGRCESCLTGAEYRCAERVRPGYRGAAGCHADKIALPARAVVRVPNDVTDKAAVLSPLLAGIYAALQRVDLPPWTNILVVGDGGAGLLAAVAFSRAGYTVTVRGKHGNRFDLLRRHNVHFNLVTDDAEVSGIRPGRFGPALIEYPYVIEASGNNSGWHAALTLCTPGGTVFQLSSCNDAVPRSLHQLQEKNIKLVGLREGPIEPVLSVLSTELFDPTHAIERVLSLEEWQNAYRIDPNGMGGITVLQMRN